MLDAHLTFIAEDPPRASWFALWDPDDRGGLIRRAPVAAPVSEDVVDAGARNDRAATPSGPTPESGAEAEPWEWVDIPVVVPASRGTERTTVAARRLPVDRAIDLLAALAVADDAGPSAHAWAAVVRFALALIADGRVLPWVSPDGFDTWRVDPLDTRHASVLDDLVNALPAEAHARPGPTRASITDGRFAVRSAMDAVADTFIRTAAAHRVSDLTLFADRAPTRATHLRPWVRDLASTHCASARLCLQMHPPANAGPDADPDPDAGPDPDPDPDSADPSEDPDPDPENAAGERGEEWRIVFQLRSRIDPSLVVDAANFWQAPAEVMQRFGDQAEVTLLRGLRRLTDIVAPLAPVLDELAPAGATLDTDGLDVLLDHLDHLADAGIDVRWPAELVAPRIERQVVVSGADAPSGGLPSMTDLASLLDVDWEFLLDDVPLTRAELDVLGAAKRAVVPLRGRWVHLDRASRERLRARPPSVSVPMAIAAALGADVEIELDDDDGADPVRVRVEGAVADLADRLAVLHRGREQREPSALDATLRPYQRRGLAWMSDLCELGLGGCLADDMGLGKTIQLLALHASRPGATLVVCPTSLLGNWRREAERFLPGATVLVHHGANRSLDDLALIDDDVLVLTTYGVVRSDVDELARHSWDLVVADEAQHAKNPRSRTARALRELPGSARIALTGTPVENRLSELWSIIDWVVPGLLGSLDSFRRQLATPIERDEDPAAAERLQRLISPFLLRRRKSDPGIAPELPPKLERDVFVPLSSEQVTLYKATVDTVMAEVEAAEGIERRGLVLKLLTGLKQITNHPAQYLSEMDTTLAGRSGKLDALDDVLGAAATAHESSLVFTQYVAMGTLLERHIAAAGHRVAMLHGGLTVTARQRLVDAFQARDLDVLILSLKAGGTGLNLTAATSVVHYDRWWNPAVEDQATDRAYRIGQDRPVTVHRFIAQGTVEDRVAELLRAKRDLADRVVGGGDAWIGELDDDELGDLVRLEVS